MISERRRSTRTIKDDEHLAEEVRKYTCLYDKTDKGYKEKERVTEAWKAIEETLGYEEGSACHLFENLKKRYSKRRIALLKATKSGNGKCEVLQHQMKVYDRFLQWLRPFIRRRQCKTPFHTVTQQDLGDNGGDESNCSRVNEIDNCDSLSSSNENDNSSVVTSSSSDGKCVRLKKGAASKSKGKKRSHDTEASQEFMSAMMKMMKHRFEKSSPKVQTSDEAFGRMIASELAGLPEMLKIQAKHEMNNVIFKFQLQSQSCNATVTNLTPFATTSLSSFNNPVAGSSNTQANNSK